MKWWNHTAAINRKKLKKKLRKVKRKKTTTTPAPVEEVMMMTPPWESAVKELGSGQTITPWTPPSPVVPARTAEEMTRGAALTLGELHSTSQLGITQSLVTSIFNCL